jgi:AraC-like DNA-binding protein
MLRGGRRSSGVLRNEGRPNIHFTEPLRIEDLATHVNRSASTFHHHFRALTAMSPLRYRKWLRLNEARQLMLTGRLDAATVAFQVGYESPSQFSREYSRSFACRHYAILQTYERVRIMLSAKRPAPLPYDAHR